MNTTEWSLTYGGKKYIITSGWQAVYAVAKITFHANECSIAMVSLQD